MKKILFIGLILAILLFAFPQGVSAAESDSATVVASVESKLDCVATHPAGTWALTRGQNNFLYGSDAVSLTVDSTTDWTLTASNSAPEGADDGHMYDATVDQQLNLPFYIETQSGMQSLESPQDLYWGPPQAINSPTYYNDFSQEVQASDYSGSNYYITILFACSPTLPEEGR
jgi:hypothetical protein